MKLKSYKPLGDRLVIRPLKHPARMGKIIIPEIARKNLLMAKVVEVSDEITSIVIGDVVLYDHYAGLIIDKEQNLMILREKDILGIMEE